LYDRAMQTAGFQQVVCAPDIGLECRQRETVGSRNKGLGAQVENHFGLIPIDHLLQGPEVLQGHIGDGYPSDDTCAVKIEARVGMAKQGHHLGLQVQKGLHQP